MADSKLEKLLQDATRAYQRRDKRKGAQLLDQILRKDFNHPGAWKLLHQLYGGKRDFVEFQRAFTMQFYPDRLAQLQPGIREEEELPAATSVINDIAPVPPPPRADETAEVAPARKPSFFARLFGVFRRKPKPVPSAEIPPAMAPTADISGPAVVPEAAPSEMHAAAHRVVIGSSDVSPLPTLPTGSTSILKAAGSQPFPEYRPTSSASHRLTPGTPFGRPVQRPADDRKIHVVVVDDIAQTRETVIRSLRFQDDIEVDGTGENGLQGIQLVRELRPDVVIMDVNMPDMDGITATSYIKKEVPYAQVIILTVQDDVDYIRKAMSAGARDFMAKPPVIEELLEAVRRAAEIARREREKAPTPAMIMAAAEQRSDSGRGKIITVYSPRGGAGSTTVACNLAVLLHTEEDHVVVVDGNLQFGDVPIFFNIPPKNDIVDLAPRVEELDEELVNTVLGEHSSGIRILAPCRPERAELVTGPQFSQLITYLSTIYSYVIVDTAHRLNDITLAALDISDLMIVLTSQDIPSIARVKKFFDLVPLLNLEPRRLMVVMNLFDQRIRLDPEKAGQAIGQPVSAVIPAASEVAVAAANRGEPFMLSHDIHSRSIGMGMLSTVEAVRKRLAQDLKDAT